MRHHNVIFPCLVIILILAPIAYSFLSVSLESLNRNARYASEKFSRPNIVKKSKPKPKHIFAKTAIKSKKSIGSSSAPIRFELGNGMYGISPKALLDQVNSTAPYYFTEKENAILSSNTTLFAYEPSKTSTEVINDLVALCTGPMGWLNVLHAYYRETFLFPIVQLEPTVINRVAYFALCMACHFSTVATYVPTDVDSKIRGHCWYDPDVSVLQSQYDIVKASMAWDVKAVSNRYVELPSTDGNHTTRVFSGHSGEWMAVMTSAWGALLRTGHDALAQEAESLIYSELNTTAAAFRRLCQQCHANETEEDHCKQLLQLSAIMTHNVGDIDQGLLSWSTNYTGTVPAAHWGKKGDRRRHALVGDRYRRLAHEEVPQRFSGAYCRAKDLYKELLSAEGHRNYPLREARCLRRWKDLQLPLGPWLEEWGHSVASHPLLSHQDKIDVITLLLRGCDVTIRPYGIPRQVGYYRALHGIFRSKTAAVAAAFDICGNGAGGSCDPPLTVDAVGALLPSSCWDTLCSEKMREHLGMSEERFASELGQRCRDILRSWT